DDFQGKGIGTLLLERLALAAEDAGIGRLSAFVLPQNEKMLQVFRDSGFEVAQYFDGGEVKICLDIEPTQASVERAEARDRSATQRSLEAFFKPRSIAVIGASRDPGSIGYRVL